VREPVGRAVTSAARHPAAWWVVAVALVLVAGAWWWAGVQEGISWEPASGAPWDELRDLANAVGLDRRR
jgi:hypothetical protein